MADDIDRAQAAEEMWRSLARAAIRPTGGHSLGPEDCVDCGEPIPQARRLAVPGTRLCVDCQADLERKR